MQTVMSLKSVRSSIRKVSKSLAVSQASREYLIKNSREIVILCSQSIIAIHKGDLKSARTQRQKASKLLIKLRKKAIGDLRKYLITPEQELVEASALSAIVEKKEVPSVMSLRVTDEAYILGLLDCIGELKRLVYDKIRTDQSHEAERIFGIMENLYLHLYPFSIYDKIVKEARRKLDVNRILLEDTRAALTVEIRRENLIGIINKLRK